MTQKLNSFEKFWKELKRRKVVHVIAVYAAVAFVILQVTNMVVRPLRLPDWTEAFVIFLLCIGFVISVFVSWVYDITPSGVKKTGPASAIKHVDQTTTATSSGWKIATYISAVIILALIAFNFISKRNLNADISKHEKSIAVLPFRNLSNDTTQLYFCDGFMEEILNNLQAVKSFTVRSRTSSDQYRDTKKPITTIGNELNANYLVEGSVGRDGNNLKIWVQLIDSKADKHIWSNDYTREMKQIFPLQSEIAKDIATELKAILSPDEIKKMEKKPTENLEAYNYYLQGNYYYWKSSSSQDYKTAISLYEKAVELDPGFALAYTGIANCLLNQYWYYYARSEDILLKSKQAIDKAVEIDPELPEAHLALGSYYYCGYLKYSQALEQYEIVLKDQPENYEAIYWSAAVYRRAGNWGMAKTYFVKAVELNPRSFMLTSDAAFTFEYLRDFSTAEKYYNMSNIVYPDQVNMYLSRMYIKWKGDTRKAREILGNTARNNKSTLSDSLIIETNVLIDIYDGNYEEALKDLSLLKSDVFEDQFYFRPKYLYYAAIYGFMKEPELERTYYDSARIFLENIVINVPDDPRSFSSLGIAYAGLGHNDQAIKTGEKAIKLLPVNKEAIKGVSLVEDLALIYVIVGKYDKAIEQIKYLLSIPGNLTTKILDLDPRWAPLKNQPEFQKILESSSGT